MKKYFNSNEKLEYCTVDVTENGQITIATQPYHAPELERLGCPPNPTHSIRGRVTMSYDRKEFVFAPYAEGARKPTYSKQMVVGSTTLGVTEDKVKISFMVPRHLAKPLMLMYIQSEIDEVKRRLETDVYDMLAASPKTRKRDSSGEMNLPSSQPTLSYRVGPKRGLADLAETKHETVNSKH